MPRRMNEYTFHFEIEIDGLDDPAIYPVIAITFSYVPGYAATGPTYSCGGEPGTGAEIDFISARLICCEGYEPTPEQVTKWAADYLASDHGYEAACDWVGDDSY